MEWLWNHSIWETHRSLLAAKIIRRRRKRNRLVGRSSEDRIQFDVNCFWFIDADLFLVLPTCSRKYEEHTRLSTHAAHARLLHGPSPLWTGQTHTRLPGQEDRRGPGIVEAEQALLVVITTFSYHARGACFMLQSAFFSLQTYSGWISLSKPLGFSM